jgi:thiol-disulfide isomerase/thioredoxin
MRTPVTVVLIGCLLAAGCGGGGGADGSEVAGSSAPPPSTGVAAPSAAPSEGSRLRGLPALLKFEAETLDGKSFTGANLAERPVVFWFWAPWCPKCAAEGPAVAKVAEKYGDRAAFVGVAGLDKNKDAMREFVRRTGTGGLTQLDDRGGELYRHFEVVEQTTYIFMTRDGKTSRDTGPLSESDLTGHVEALTGSA